MVNNHGYIIHKTNIREDEDTIMIFIKITILSLPNKLLMSLILGYLGIEKDFPEQLSSLPNRKKEKPFDLSQEQKEYNKIHAKKRIVIEHAICRLKKYRILAWMYLETN